MEYLELEDLVIGQQYKCVFYGGHEEVCPYLGNGNFEKDGESYPLEGNIRYVLPISKRNIKKAMRAKASD